MCVSPLHTRPRTYFNSHPPFNPGTEETVPRKSSGYPPGQTPGPPHHGNHHLQAPTVSEPRVAALPHISQRFSPEGSVEATGTAVPVSQIFEDPLVAYNIPKLKTNCQSTGGWWHFNWKAKSEGSWKCAGYRNVFHKNICILSKKFQGQVNQVHPSPKTALEPIPSKVRSTKSTQVPKQP